MPVHFPFELDPADLDDLDERIRDRSRTACRLRMRSIRLCESLMFERDRDNYARMLACSVELDAEIVAESRAETAALREINDLFHRLGARPGDARPAGKSLYRVATAGNPATRLGAIIPADEPGETDADLYRERVVEYAEMIRLGSRS